LAWGNGSLDPNYSSNGPEPNNPFDSLSPALCVGYWPEYGLFDWPCEDEASLAVKFAAASTLDKKESIPLDLVVCEDGTKTRKYQPSAQMLPVLDDTRTWPGEQRIQCRSRDPCPSGSAWQCGWQDCGWKDTCSWQTSSEACGCFGAYEFLDGSILPFDSPAWDTTHYPEQNPNWGIPKWEDNPRYPPALCVAYRPQAGLFDAPCDTNQEALGAKMICDDGSDPRRGSLEKAKDPDVKVLGFLQMLSETYLFPREQNGNQADPRVLQTVAPSYTKTGSTS